MEALIIVVLALAAMAAAAFEIRLATDQHPRRFWMCWAAWTPIAIGAVATLAWGDGPADAVVLALLVGTAIYPICRVWGWLDNLRYGDPEEAAKERERVKYHAMDFGGPPAKPPPIPEGMAAASVASSEAAMARPMATTPVRSVLTCATTEKRSRVASGIEWAAIGFACVIGMMSLLGFSLIDYWGGGYDPGAAVVETLELRGFAAPRIDDAPATAFCNNGNAFVWSAAGARGRACVDDYDGAVSLWVDRRWPPMRAEPTPATAAPAIPAATLP